jgi:hypothetical protein
VIGLTEDIRRLTAGRELTDGDGDVGKECYNFRFFFKQQTPLPFNRASRATTVSRPLPSADEGEGAFLRSDTRSVPMNVFARLEVMCRESHYVISALGSVRKKEDVPLVPWCAVCALLPETGERDEPGLPSRNHIHTCLVDVVTQFSSSATR